MNIDLGSFAYGSTLENGAGTPSWGTSLGQSRPEYYITREGSENIVMGMVYCAVPLESVSLPLGKGGRVCNCLEAGTIQIASVFKKVFVNNVQISHPFIMVLQKEDSDSHSGRRGIKYTDKTSFVENNEHNYSNSDFIRLVYNKFRLEENACWFVYDIDVKNYEELHFKAIFVNNNQSEVYTNSQKRSEEWSKLIERTGNKYKVRFIENSPLKLEDQSLQQIFYGAPGTGKSHRIKEKEGDFSKVIRTTFHPDSDYSTFVGAYKPTMASKERIYSADELIGKLTTIKESGISYPCHKFSAQYWESLKDLSAAEIKRIITACGFTDTMTVEVGKGISIGQELASKSDDKKITYTFVKQAFLKAYIEAWNRHDKGENVLLVIEEINRGNCAQIFGDLFQLLDRNDEGFSDYPIQADEDLRKVLADEFANLNNIPENVKSGEELLLPNNLYIWATMNTSDQSLFPIDSAFKRRWDWKYVPIDTAKERWTIKVNGKEYSWTSFLNTINEKIYAKTQSEDKQLGFYFCKAEGDVISAERLVSKVLFYVYNDVFKDYGFDDSFFNSDNGKLTFQGYYKTDGKINEEKVAMFLNNLEVEEIDIATSDLDIEMDTEGAGKAEHKETLVAVTINGERLTAEGSTQFDLYLNAIKKIGADIVGPTIETMKYRRKGSPMATKTQVQSLLDSDGYSYVELDGYYFVKGANGYTLTRILEDLNERLNLKIQIEYR